MTSSSASRDLAAASSNTMISEWETGASVGTIIQDCPFDFMNGEKKKVDRDLLQPGDVLYYDWSGGNGNSNFPGDPDGTTDHVAIYVGEDANGRGVIFEICSPDNPPHFDYLSTDGAPESDASLSPGWGYQNIIQVRRYIPA